MVKPCLIKTTPLAFALAILTTSTCIAQQPLPLKADHDASYNLAPPSVPMPLTLKAQRAQMEIAQRKNILMEQRASGEYAARPAFRQSNFYGTHMMLYRPYQAYVRTPSYPFSGWVY